MKKNKVFIYLAEALELYLQKSVPRASASLAYYLTLSVFPLIICISGLLGTLNLEASSVINLLNGLLPASTLETLIEYLNYVSENRSVPLIIGGLLLLITASSAAYRTISATMVDIQGASLFSGIVGAIFSFVFSIIFLLVIYASIFIVITGRWFWTILENRFELTFLVNLWSWFRFVLLFLMLFVLVSLIYKLTTPHRSPRRPIITGAAAASVALVLVSVIFSLFIGRSSRYPLVYGSLTSIIVLMLWLYICGTILILGSIVNYLRYIHSGEKNEDEKEKGAEK